MNRVWYDTEFIENGRTIDLISIGMVREDGAEYYAVSSDSAEDDIKSRIQNHQWLMENVVPHLPVTSKPSYRAGENSCKWGFYHLDLHSPLVKPAWVIRNEVTAFLAVPQLQLRAWYGAYDHVVLMQLWGRMIDKPEGIPMWTFDLKQEADRLGNPQVPDWGTEHNALDDAKRAREIDRFLEHYLATEWQE